MEGGASSTSVLGKGTFQPDTDVHITYEDQQRINQFARHNAWLEDMKEELTTKQNELKNLEDAVEEVMLLDEDEDQVPYLVGEGFMVLTVPDTQENLEGVKEKLKEEIKLLGVKISDVKEAMSQLKVQLYGKFGTNINLENEEE